MIVDTGPDRAEIIVDGQTINKATGSGSADRLAAEIDVLIFDFCRPVRSEQIFDTAADYPSGFELI